MEKMHEIVDAVVEAGKIMLESGSEIYRSEETMIRLAKSFGISEIDIFTLATCIYVTCDIDGDSYTRIRRIYPKATDLSKISRVNQLSRDMAKNPLDLAGFKERLKEIDEHCKPKKIIVASSMALACGVFAFMLQNCTLKDFISTTCISFIAYYLLDYLGRFHLHALFKNMLVTVFMTLGAVLCVETGLGVKIDDIVIGNIMLVVPGVALTNAVRDTLNGDVLSGLIRMLEAITIAIGIAIGVGLVLFFYKNGWRVG